MIDRRIGWIEKHLKIPVNREKSGSGPTQMLLAALENPARAPKCSAAARGQRPGTGQLLLQQRGLADGPPLGSAPGSLEQNTRPTWVPYTLEFCGGTSVTSAGFNRRMRKTARPVVWKGCGAKSPHPHPIRKSWAPASQYLKSSLSSTTSWAQTPHRAAVGRGDWCSCSRS